MKISIPRGRAARTGLAVVTALGLLFGAVWAASHLPRAGQEAAGNVADVGSPAAGPDSSPNSPGSNCSNYQPQSGFDLDVCITVNGRIVTPSINVSQLGNTGTSCVIVLETWDDAGNQLDPASARSVKCAVGQASGASFDPTTLTGQTVHTSPSGSVNVHAFARLILNGNGIYIPGQGNSPTVTVPVANPSGCQPGDSEAGCHVPPVAQLPVPPSGWIAGASPAPNSDPINLVMYDPNGHAADALQAALMASGASNTKTRKWFPNNSCYNTSVQFAPDQAGVFKSPDASYSTDASHGADFLGYTGCGTVGVVRDHLRLWKNSGNTIAWVAASDEVPLNTVDAASQRTVHDVAQDGFNSGRAGLVNDLQAGLNAMGQVNGLTYTYTYSLQANVYTCSGLQNPTNLATKCDGNVAFFVLSSGSGQAQQQPQTPAS